MPVFGGDVWWAKLLIILSAAFCLFLLLYIFLHPFINKDKNELSIAIHPTSTYLKTLPIPNFNTIAVALDFSVNDEKLLAFALGQGKEDSFYLLIHIVESASAILHGKDSNDYETIKDKEQMDFYVNQLKERGFNAKGFIGYKNRNKEIVKLVVDNNADMLVIGAHGHTGIKDFIYGETVNAVRHELKIPVLIVNV
jgi:manganese transport protein